MQKTKIIYICGMGHNGSTALDLLLDQSEDCVGTSQLNDFLVLYDPFENENQRPDFVNTFWSKLANQLTESQRKTLRSANHGVLKEKSLLPFAFSKKRRQQYAEINNVVIQEFQQAHPGKIIVDSSKNISRLLGLLEMKDTDIYVVHLTRDIRGYVESHNKRRKEHGLSVRFVIPTLVWVAKNAAASLLAKPRAKHYLHVRYEQMMLEPDKFLTQLGEFVGCSLTSCIPTLKGKSPLTPANSLGFLGNRVLQNREDVFLDPARIRNDGLFKSKLYWYTLGWTARFWGYQR